MGYSHIPEYLKYLKQANIHLRISLLDFAVNISFEAKCYSAILIHMNSTHLFCYVPHQQIRPITVITLVIQYSMKL